MMWKRLAPVVIALCFVSFVLLQGQPVGVAQRQGDIGIIDLEAIWSGNVLPALEGPLAQETALLQAELDAAVADKSDAEKQQIFDAYQARLYALQQELVDELLDEVRRVIGEVADRKSVV